MGFVIMLSTPIIIYFIVSNMGKYGNKFLFGLLYVEIKDFNVSSHTGFEKNLDNFNGKNVTTKWEWFEEICGY